MKWFFGKGIKSEITVERVSRRKMLFLLESLYFEKAISKEEVSEVYRFVVGKGDDAAVFISRNGYYKLTINNKKRLKIYLQNLQDGVIYFYNVKFGRLWREQVQSKIADALLMQVAKKNFFKENEGGL